MTRSGPSRSGSSGSGPTSRGPPGSRCGSTDVRCRSTGTGCTSPLPATEPTRSRRLRARYDEGFLLTQLGSVALSKTLDTRWQDTVMGLYRRTCEILARGVRLRGLLHLRHAPGRGPRGRLHRPRRRLRRGVRLRGDRRRGRRGRPAARRADADRARARGQRAPDHAAHQRPGRPRAPDRPLPLLLRRRRTLQLPVRLRGLRQHHHEGLEGHQVGRIPRRKRPRAGQRRAGGRPPLRRRLAPTEAGLQLGPRPDRRRAARGSSQHRAARPRSTGRASTAATGTRRDRRSSPS